MPAGKPTIRTELAANLALRREHVAIRVVFFLAPFVTLVASLTTVPVLIILALCCVGLALMHGQSASELFRVDAGVAMFGLIAFYLLINATWSADISGALRKALWFSLVAIMAFAVVRAMSRWDQRQTRIAAASFLAGAIVGLIYLLFELVTEQSLARLLYNTLPALRPNPKLLTMQDDRVVGIMFSELNQEVAVLLLMLWPALLCVWWLAGGPRRFAIMAALFASAFAAVMISEHESSKIALIASIVVFLTARFWPAFARRGVGLAWCLAFLLVVPLASMAFQHKLQEQSWLPQSARERIVIWAYTAEHIHETPLLGIGLDSTRTLNKELRLNPDVETIVDIVRPHRRPFKWGPGQHAHNVFLQTWYELGAIGVLLFTATGLVLLGNIARLPVATQPFLLAQFAALFGIAAFSWGMWQSWFMAVAGLASIYAALAVRGAEAPVMDQEDAKASRPVKSPLSSSERPA